jgi:sucrose-6-phosphate hydrolase SacC (GH32 family)
MTWGHAVSPDLVHWQQLPNAIEPDKMGTIYSGSAVVDHENTAGFQKGDEKTIVALYTAAGGKNPASNGQPFTQCLAYSTDAGRTFTKFDGNPILKHIVAENRDPKVVWHAATRRWIMALYLDRNDFALFSSPDLKAWTEIQRLTIPSCSECPDFFEMPVEGKPDLKKWIFLTAPGRYLVGSFDGKAFTKESETLRLDYGRNFYAQQTYSDIPATDGRRIQIAWMRDGKYPGMPFNQQMSFPCELVLRHFAEGLRVCRTPVREIEKLYGREHKWTDKPILRGDAPLPGVNTDLLDITAEIDHGNSAELGITINGQDISYAPAQGRITALGQSAILQGNDPNLKLRILVDRTSVEVFVNGGRVSLSSCFVPDPGKRTITTHSAGGSARFINLSIRELRPAW